MQPGCGAPSPSPSATVGPAVARAPERHRQLRYLSKQRSPIEGDPFDALGDPNRRAIVEQLRAGDRSVGELAAALPISRPAVSRHLRLLKEAGLVTDRAEGTRRLYRLHDAGIQAVRRLP